MALATRRDLERLEERLSLRFESALNRGLNSQTKTLVFSSIGSMAAMLGGAAAISNLFG